MSERMLQELFDYKSIVELKAAFVRTVDAKDWAGFRAVFSDDCIFDFGGGFVVEGGEAGVNAIRGQLEGGVSVHRAFLPEIAFSSPTEAKGEWAVNDYIEWTTGSAGGERHGFQGFGREYETYRKIGNAWKIAHWRVHYIRIDSLPRAPLPRPILGGPDLLRDEAYLAAVTARGG